MQFLNLKSHLYFRSLHDPKERSVTCSIHLTWRIAIINCIDDFRHIMYRNVVKGKLANDSKLEIVLIQ